MKAKPRGRGRPVGSKNGDAVTLPTPFRAWTVPGGWCVRIGNQTGVKRGLEISILAPCLATVVEGCPIITGIGVVRLHDQTIAINP